MKDIHIFFFRSDKSCILIDLAMLLCFIV